MNIKRKILQFITKIKYQQFVKDTLNIQKVQQHLWQKEIFPILHQGDFWPQQKDISQNKHLHDFNITSYENYQPYLEKALSSDIQPINSETILFWSETSATTGQRKFFPITKSFQKQFQKTMPPYFYSLMSRYPGFLKEPIIYLAGWDTGVYSKANINMGLISHYNYKNLPSLIQHFYGLPQEVFRDEDTFSQWAPVYALSQDLSAFFGVVPIVIDTFIKKCLANFTNYLPYLLNEKPMPDGLPELTITSERQLYLKKIQVNTLDYKKLWPSLCLVGTWIEGPCKTYATALQQSLGKHVPVIDGTYSATEGWLTVPVSESHQGGVFHPRTHIVEFIEEGLSITKDNLIPAWDLEKGHKYEVFLTTSMGFVRYRLKDVVECTGFFNQAPILSFCYKVATLLLDYCALSEQDLREAVALAEIELEPYWFFACDSNRNRLNLVVDYETTLQQQDADTIHQKLIESNEKYAFEVKQGNILGCQLKLVDQKKLLKNHHAQTKPKIISQEIVD